MELGERASRGDLEEVALDEQLADVYAEKYQYRPKPGNPSESWYRLRPRIAYAWDRTYPRTATQFLFDEPVPSSS